MEAPKNEVQPTYYAGQSPEDQLKLDVDACVEAEPKTIADPDREIVHTYCGTPVMPVESEEERIARQKAIDAYYKDRRDRIMNAAKDIADIAVAFHLTPGELLDAVNHAQDSMCFATMPADLRPPEGCW